MSSSGRRLVWLVSAAALLAALVAADRLLLRRGVEAQPVAEPLVEKAAQLAKARAVASQEEQWRTTLEAEKQQVRTVKERMIEAPSVEVAGARLKQVVQEVMRDVGVTLDVSDTTSAKPVLEGEPVHLVGLQLQFRTNDPETLYALIDKLEHMPDLLTNVSRVRILGPGRSGGAGLEVTMDLQALSWIVRSGQ
ncbi:MAG: hypothetical protein D6824_00640 [Planctomycetota bacterium]|nr:MAG: hypothetical protein D6824_00640 [Planctomycetota bacterium]